MKVISVIYLILITAACANPNHTSEQFIEKFQRHKTKVKVYENQSELESYLQAKGGQCFGEASHRSNGNIGADYKTTIEVHQNSKTSSVINYKLNVRYKNSFGIKTPDVNSFVAIAKLKAINPSSTQLETVCRNDKVCKAFKLWANKEHDGCPTNYVEVN